MARRSPKGSKDPLHPPRELTAERETRAWELRLAGLTQRQIAKKLGVSQQAVSQALARVERRVLDELRESIESHKAAQHEQLLWLVREAVKGWRRSLKSTVTVKTLPDGSQEVTSKSTSGDTSKLNAAMSALADIRKLWGLDAKANESPAASEAIDPDVAEVAIAAALAAQAAKRKGGQA